MSCDVKCNIFVYSAFGYPFFQSSIDVLIAWQMIDIRITFKKSVFDPCPLGWRLPPFQILERLGGKFNKSANYIGSSTTSNYGAKPINISASGYWEPTSRNSIVFCEHAYLRGASGIGKVISPWCILRAGGNFEAYPVNNGMGGILPDTILDV